MKQFDMHPIVNLMDESIEKLKANQMDNIQKTSLFAYDTIKHDLNRRQQQVYDAIERLEYATAKDVSKFLQLPINSITGRINELLYIKQSIKIDDVHFNQNIYSIRLESDPLNKRNLTPEQKLKVYRSWLSRKGLYISTEEAIKKLDEIVK